MAISSDTIEAVFRVQDQASAKLQAIAGEFEQVEGSTEKAEKRSGSLESAWKGLSVSTTALVAGLSALAAGLAATTFSAAQHVRELNQISARTGLARDTIQGLELAFAGAGYEISEIDGIMGGLKGQLDAVRTGSAESVAIFQRLGVQVRGEGGAFRNLNTIFLDTIKGLNNIKDPTEKNILTMKLFSEAGGKLTAAIGESDSALQNYISRAQQIAPISEEAAARTAELGAGWAEAKLHLFSFGMSLLDLLGYFGNSQSFFRAFGAGLHGLAIILKGMGNIFYSIHAVTKAVFAAIWQELKDLLGDLQKLLSGDIAGAIKGALTRDLGSMGVAGLEVAKFWERQKKLTDQGIASIKAALDTTFSFSTSLPQPQSLGSGGGVPPQQAAAGAVQVEAAAVISTKNLAETVKNVDFHLAPLGPALGGFVDTVDASTDELGRIQDDLRNQKLQSASSAISGIGGGIASGDATQLISSIASMFGPKGEIVAAVVGVLSALGSSENLGKMLAESGQLIVDGVKAIPDLLAKDLPYFLQEFLPALVVAVGEAVPAIIGALPDLIEGLLFAVTEILGEGLPALLIGLADAILLIISPAFLADLLKAIAVGLGIAIIELFKGLFQFVTTKGVSTLAEIYKMMFWPIVKISQIFLDLGAVTDNLKLAIQAINPFDGISAREARNQYQRTGGAKNMVQINGFATNGVLRELFKKMNRNTGERGLRFRLRES